MFLPHEPASVQANHRWCVGSPGWPKATDLEQGQTGTHTHTQGSLHTRIVHDIRQIDTQPSSARELLLSPSLRPDRVKGLYRAATAPSQPISLQDKAPGLRWPISIVVDRSDSLCAALFFLLPHALWYTMKGPVYLQKTTPPAHVPVIAHDVSPLRDRLSIASCGWSRSRQRGASP